LPPPPSKVALLFEPLAWSQPGDADPGLAISAHVIASLGGTLGFARAPGRGSQYVVDVPRHAAIATTARAA
jgi:signal transduction histidine kinase